METKTSQAVALFSKGELVQSLAIFKTFRIGFTADERRTIQIAHESLTGKEEFYRQLRLKTDVIKNEAISIIKTKYNL
jgi:gamma-glutamylcysteine synthetase